MHCNIDPSDRSPISDCDQQFHRRPPSVDYTISLVNHGVCLSAQPFPRKATTTHIVSKSRHKRTDTRNRIRCILSLKCDIWWQYFNDFPDNHSDQISCIYWSIPEFYPLLKFLRSITLLPPTGQTPLTDTTDVSLCPYVS